MVRQRSYIQSCHFLRSRRPSFLRAKKGSRKTLCEAVQGFDLPHSERYPNVCSECHGRVSVRQLDQAWEFLSTGTMVLHSRPVVREASFAPHWTSWSRSSSPVDSSVCAYHPHLSEDSSVESEASLLFLHKYRKRYLLLWPNNFDMVFHDCT